MRGFVDVSVTNSEPTRKGPGAPKGFWARLRWRLGFLIGKSCPCGGKWVYAKVQNCSMYGHLDECTGCGATVYTSDY
jgi:hypothetical protein